ncbi:hypothetical protein DFJ74DRAFT_393081 [Hyaloraphidium curvatum]|nr:hypothetical protein DFJ74DRAFT_393081 [Hyaloraphidium curvatum]
MRNRQLLLGLAAFIGIFGVQLAFRARGLPALWPQSLSAPSGTLAAAAHPAGPPVWMCLLVRNANEDAAEWLDYHRSIGVSQFLVYDDGSSPPFPHASADVDVRPVPPGPRGNVAFPDSPQHRAYARCASRCPAGGWMGFVDVDEFVVLRKERPWLPTFLDGFPNASGVHLNWIVMVGKEHETRPGGGTLASYSNCLPTSYNTSRTAKTFARCRDLLGMHNAHQPLLTPGATVVNAEGAPAEYVPRMRAWLTNPSHGGPAALYHYIYKSTAEALAKIGAPDQQYKPRSLGDYRKLRDAATASCTYLRDRVVRCCPLVMDWMLGSSTSGDDAVSPRRAHSGG